MSSPSPHRVCGSVDVVDEVDPVVVYDGALTSRGMVWDVGRLGDCDVFEARGEVLEDGRGEVELVMTCGRWRR